MKKPRLEPQPPARRPRNAAPPRPASPGHGPDPGPPEHDPRSPQYWRRRWAEGRIGFHRNEVNPLLARFYPRLELAPGDSVFVPLCGKSVDMAWLAERGHPVIGCEVSGAAIAGFFEAAALSPQTNSDGNLRVWRAGPYTLYEGDYFQLTPRQVGAARAVYDRGALIALPKAARRAYLGHMRDLCGVGVKTLLITLDYDQAAMPGPPFAVDYEEVVWQYAFDHVIEFLAERDVLEEEQKFKQRGLNALTEWAYLLTRYTPAYAAFSEIPTDF